MSSVYGADARKLYRSLVSRVRALRTFVDEWDVRVDPRTMLGVQEDAEKRTRIEIKITKQRKIEV